MSTMRMVREDCGSRARNGITGTGGDAEALLSHRRVTLCV